MLRRLLGRALAVSALLAVTFPGAAQPAAIYRADELLPLRQSSTVFRFIEGDREGESIVATLSPRSRGVWVLDLEDMRREFLGLNARGDIVLLGEELPGEGYALHYDPPPVLVPAVVEPGMERRQTGEVRIYRLDRDGALEETSRYEHTLRARGTRLVPADGGRMKGIVITTERSADVGAAQIEATIENAYHPGVGRVYQRTATSTRGGPFNLWSDTTVHTIRYSSQNR